MTINILEFLSGNEIQHLETVRQLRDALRAYIRCGGAISLHRTLGLPEPGQHKRMARLRRNIALRRALAVCEGDNLSQRVEALGRALRRFEGTHWRNWKDMPSAPSDASELNRQLHIAFCAARDGELPRNIPSDRHLFRLVTKKHDEMS